jgi:tRNA G10  N-methylase Trm11
VLRQGDVRRLEITDGSVSACVSNLPFGRQHTVPQDIHDWLRDALAELARVTRPGGRVVLLAPDIPGDVRPGVFRRTGRTPIRLLGTRTTIWAYDRRP